MAKINNQQRYRLRQLKKLDNFIGSKVDENGKTVVYNGQGVIDIVLAEYIVSFGDRVIVGGYEHVVGYTYKCWAEKYVIDGALYVGRIDGEVTLDASHPNLDRVDVITVIAHEDPTPHGFGFVKGDSAVNPAKPDIDTNEVQLTFVNVKAGSNEPENLQKIKVFNENLGVPTEWNPNINGSLLIDLDNVEQASLDDKSAKFTLAQDVESLSLESTISINHDRFSLLKFDIFLLNENDHRIWVRMLDLAGTGIVGDGYLVIKHGQYGFDANLLEEWQTVYLTRENFNVLLSSPLLSEILIENKENDSSYHIDNIELQFGLEPVGVLPTMEYSLEETETIITLLNEGVAVSTVSKGTAVVFGNTFTHIKPDGSRGNGNIELHDMACHGLNQAKTRLINTMVFLNTLNDMDKDNEGNWDILTYA